MCIVHVNDESTQCEVKRKELLVLKMCNTAFLFRPPRIQPSGDTHTQIGSCAGCVRGEGIEINLKQKDSFDRVRSLLKQFSTIALYS